MRRWKVLFLLALPVLMLSACSSSDKKAAPEAVATVALFANTDYADYNTGSTSSEGWGMHSALLKKTLVTDTFTGIASTDFSTALAGKDTLVIPEQSGLAAALDSAAINVIADFVDEGGVLVLGGDSDGGAADVLNLVFGYDTWTTGNGATEPITLDTTAAADTRFEGAPATLPANDGTYTIAGNWPYGAKTLYADDNGEAMVVLIPRGQGYIVYLGYDWYDALPVGSQDGGWNGILATAANLGRALPDVYFPNAIDSGYIDDVEAKLFATGQFNLVESFAADLGTPGLSDLMKYDAALVSSDGSFDDNVLMGDNLADFVDAGGGVVNALFSFNGSYGLMGRFYTDGYFAIPGNVAQNDGTNATLGEVFLPDHPIMNQVTTFDGGADSYRADTLSVVAGATRVADWSDGSPLVAVSTINGTRRADLGFYPPSNDTVGSGFWLAGTDGDLLMANALTWTAELPVAQRATVGSTIPDYPAAALTSTITVARAFTVRKVTVTVNIEHTYVGDLRISLSSPDGTTIYLSDMAGSSGENFMGTTFDDAGHTWIGDATAPFTGTFTPESALSNFTGEAADGVWTLTVLDNDSGGVGTLLGWTLCVR